MGIVEDYEHRFYSCNKGVHLLTLGSKDRLLAGQHVHPGSFWVRLTYPRLILM